MQKARLGVVGVALACALAAVPAHAQPANGDDGEGDGNEMPAGHPHIQGQAGHGGMEPPPEDGSAEDPSAPPGTIRVLIADAQGKPTPGATVTLGILYTSVAKGESRKRISATADAAGIATFEHLDTGSGVAYRAMVLTEGATFSVPPFQLPAKNGMRALLHVYPVTGDVEATLVVSQSILYTEIKDDRVQIQEAFRIYNFGKSAWVPNDFVIPLPEGFTAFTTQQGMTDVGIDAIPNRGARIRGTFSPGQHVIEFRWQLPYSGEPEVRFEVGTPPHTAAARVIAPASRDMKLEVEGFPPPQTTNDGSGQRSLLTEKQLRREDPPLKSIAVVVRGLPTEGPGKIVATVLAALGVGLGIRLGTRKRAHKSGTSRRDTLLDEITALERGHQAGDIGPKTYERARQELLDALARTLGDDSAKPKARSRARRPDVDNVPQGAGDK